MLAAIALRAMATVVAATVMTPTSAESPRPSDIDCLERLDSLVEHAEIGSSDASTVLFDSLSRLDALCPDVPQIAHNLAVSAARLGDLTEAERQFERALSMNEPAGDTWRQWRALKRYQADQSLAKALSSERRPSAPAFRFQTAVPATDAEADRAVVAVGSAARMPGQARQSDQRIQIEYELYALWQERTDRAARDDYYSGTLPNAMRGAVIGKMGKGTEWQDLGRQIEMLGDIAVVILTSGDMQRALLLMERQGSRWKVSQELPL